MRALLAAVALLLLPAAARADERILSFVSDVGVQKNGDFDVTETIIVQSEGREINHGIQRDFPTSYSSDLGQRTHVGFRVVSVRMDGADEKYELIEISNGERVRIGRGDVELQPGRHVFEIRYVTTRQLRRHADADEVYWNATGNGWTFPIDSAEARVRLPKATQFGNRAVYTGPQGSTAHDAFVASEAPGTIIFRTNRPLGAEEGLTVAVDFPKGVIDEASAGERLRWWIQDWGPLIAAAIGVAGILAFLIYAYAHAGRDPRKGTIVPIFVPPDELSAAAMRYIRRMASDNRGFSAALVELGVRGHLRIDKGEDGWIRKGKTTVSRIAGSSALPAPEGAMLEKLFSKGDSVLLEQANHAVLQKARSALGSNLDAAYKGKLFHSNGGWTAAAFLSIPVAMALAAMVAILAQDLPEMRSARLPLMAIAAAAGILLLRPIAKRDDLLKLVGWLGGIVCGFILIGTAFGSVIEALQLGAWAVLLPLATLPFVFSALWWMPAPTVEGRRVLDRIEGFRQYLGITEESRLETLHPPDKTPELFERYLPHAIALDVENKWADRFASVLAAAAAAGTTGSALGWYSGSPGFWNDPGGFANDVGSSLASAVASASSSPSSSGSGGGGSSGGGGGGGGGSGW